MQPLTRTLRRHDIQVINQPLKTLQQEFLSPKFRQPIEHQPNVVYKIPCADCDWYYVGETGRCFETLKNEHIRNVKKFANGSNIAKHAWSFNHSVDLIIQSSFTDKGSFRVRKTLEAWHASATKHADNNSKPIPNQYSILFAHGCYVTSMSVGGNRMALDHSFTHSLTHSLTHHLYCNRTDTFLWRVRRNKDLLFTVYCLLFTHSLTHSFTHSLAHSLTHSLTHSILINLFIKTGLNRFSYPSPG